MMQPPTGWEPWQHGEGGEPWSCSKVQDLLKVWVMCIGTIENIPFS
jgi:hypothetical protein